MAKPVIGVDIGYDNLKLALVKKGVVNKVVCVPMPKNMMSEGRIVSNESMGELLRRTIKETGLRAPNAAVVLPNDNVYIKNVVMPLMTAEQLAYNLPFEFHDYITEELNSYIFDYAMIEAHNDDQEGQDAEEEPSTMEMLAVGMPRAGIDDLAAITRKAGLRLTMAAPALCSYIALIREKQKDPAWEASEICIIDLGYQAIRMYMFSGDRHMATRSLEIGLSVLDDVVADVYNVDVHLAHTYLTTDYDSCQSRQECLNAYENIAVELMRAVNFYHFSNPGSHIDDVWLCGGGAALQPLREAIGDSLDMMVHPAEELVPGGENIEDCNTFVQAIGIALS